MSKSAPKPTVVRDFTDAGTGESFTKGATPDFESGALINYQAAGLVTKPDVSAETPSA